MNFIKKHSIIIAFVFCILLFFGIVLSREEADEWCVIIQVYDGPTLEENCGPLEQGRQAAFSSITYKYLYVTVDPTQKRVVAFVANEVPEGFVPPS
jgi:hypothetical protein